MEFGSVLNRLRDTVSATVYQVTSNLSTALPGNPLTREYELVRQVGSAGPGMIWKIYDATKKSTKENAGLWILEKKVLDTRLPNKRDKEAFLDSVRKGVGQLTRLRHPSMLTVQHNIEESRDLIAFATEPVVGSLSNFFDDNKKSLNTEDSVENDDTNKKLNVPFYDVEIKYGLLQISEGLLFLHKDAKILHRNLSPENIILNRNGIWKIAGFDFSVSALNPNETPLKFASLKVMPDLAAEVQPNFTYSSPESLSNNGNDITTSSDIFSFGMLAYTLYNSGKVLQPFTSSHQYNTNKYIDDLQAKLNSSALLSNIPDDFKRHLKLLLSFDPQLRPDAQQISKLAIFEDILVKTLQYFDSLFQWDNQQKSQFYKNLPEVLNKIPKRVRLRRIVNGLAKEFVNPEMVPFVLPNMIQIAKETNDEEFHTWIVPDLVTVFKYKEPIQIGIYLLQNMEFLVVKFKSKPDSIKEHILPLIYRFLESDAYQIQEITLSVIPSVIHLIDYSSAKNMLLPRIKRLTLHTTILSVRVNSLICLGKIVESLDKWLVLDEVLSLVMNIPSREPAVIMSTVGILKLILNSNKLGIAKDVLATKVIPFLVPLSIENGLTLQQYNTIMTLIREMLCKVEDEHQTKLRQLDSIKVQQDNFFQNPGTTAPNISSNLSQTSNIFDEFQSAPVNSSADGSNIQTNMNFLSLDDKERLANEKEQLKRMNNELPLQPKQMNSSGTNKTGSDGPKDLTSSLITSNLNMLNSSSTNTNKYSAFQSVQTIPTSHSQPNFAAFQQYPIQQQSYNQAQTPQTQQSQINYSALDNLNIMPGSFANAKPTTQSMNALKQQQFQQPASNNNPWNTQPIKPNYNINLNTGSTTGQSGPSKALSKSELDEFLK